MKGSKTYTAKLFHGFWQITDLGRDVGDFLQFPLNLKFTKSLGLFQRALGCFVETLPVPCDILLWNPEGGTFIDWYEIVEMQQSILHPTKRLLPGISVQANSTENINPIALSPFLVGRGDWLVEMAGSQFWERFQT